MNPETEKDEVLESEARVLIEKIERIRLTEIIYKDHELTEIPARSAYLFREGLTWRIAELARCALTHISAGDIIAGITLVRAVTETAVACWYLKETMEEQIRDIGGAVQLHHKVLQLYVGSRNWEDVPQAINVMTFLKRAEKSFQGVEKGYAVMSEYAHPNWAGTTALYSKRDDEKGSSSFGQGMRSAGEKGHALNALVGALGVFFAAHGKTGELVPDFIAACELAPIETPPGN